MFAQLFGKDPALHRILSGMVSSGERGTSQLGACHRHSFCKAEGHRAPLKSLLWRERF